jgi:hypothetical protein
MAQVLVDGPIERLKSGYQEDNRTSGCEHAGHGFQRCSVILDVFQHIDDDAGVRPEAGQLAKFRRDDVAYEGVQVFVVRVSSFEKLDAFRFDVHCNDGFAIE